ncbi:unnamed protein product [Phyllotreta striolata]|uniref:Uncharacterized protein n=1 Tax=Phyllotreta striolata TaxID=444603 RepID=A0A9N9TSW4_PHYSR|nr:unnamed protein product [Phyllotreta striolata]
MTLDLPQDPKDSRSSSDSSTKGTEHLHRVTYIGRDNKPLDSRLPAYDPNKSAKEAQSGQGAGENYPYVQLTAVHEYNYPSDEQQKPASLRRDDSTSSLKKCNIGAEMNPPQQPPLPYKAVKHKGKVQIRCRHCHELYTEERNRRGACEYAPDLVRSTINRITCIECAQCIDYHCAADQEGDFAQHPCDCSGDENCTKRWCCLTFLSVLVPCLWLYPPLKLCHWCGVKCGACGGRHSM